MAYFNRFACVAMLVALSAPALAQPADASRADQARAAALKKEGDALVHESKFHEALEKYDASFAIVPNPAIHYNRGRALQSLGDFPAALDELDRFVATAPPDLKAKVPNLAKTMAEIASHVSTLVVRCEVPGASVAVRGKAAGTTPMQPLRMTPGDATITVTAPGYVVFTEDRTLAAGESTTVDVKLRKAASQEVSSAQEPTPFDAEHTPPPAAHPAASGHGGWKTVAWVSGGIGIAALGTGLVFFGLSVADKSNADPHCPNKTCDAIGRQSINEAWTFADVSTVLVVTGAVALALSATSFIVTPKGAPVQARLFVAPGGAAIGGSF
ncbi:MAG TPA: PEGA domain-containing protein [Polyangiaceae bacterium]|nr:PEGA domain-containing protein [Polyangiaceae bacterium]